MIIRVQSGLGTPIYLQIESQVKHAIAAGALQQNDLLRADRLRITVSHRPGKTVLV